MRNKQSSKRGSRVFWGLTAAAWGAVLLWYLAPMPPALIERGFTLGWYRLMIGALTPITERVPFSIALALLALLIVGYPAAWAWRWVRLRRRGASHFAGLWTGLRWALCGVPVLTLWFLVFWGAGYQRIPVDARLSLDGGGIGAEEGEHLKLALLAIIERDGADVAGDRDVDRAVASIAEAMRGVVREWEGRGVTLPSRVKATPAGLLLSGGTAGICVPWTLEPHVDGGLPPTAFVAALA